MLGEAEGVLLSWRLAAPYYPAIGRLFAAASEGTVSKLRLHHAVHCKLPSPIYSWHVQSVGSDQPNVFFHGSF